MPDIVTGYLVSDIGTCALCMRAMGSTTFGPDVYLTIVNTDFRSSLFLGHTQEAEFYGP